MTKDGGPVQLPPGIVPLEATGIMPRRVEAFPQISVSRCFQHAIHLVASP